MRWLEAARVDDEPLGLADAVLAGFLRVVTHPRVFRTPSPIDVALAFCEALRAAPAALRVVNTPEEVAQLIMHLAGAKGGPREMKFVMLNGVPSVWFVDGQGFETAAQFDIADDMVRAIYIQRNPEKLQHLKLH